ncbi:MULTISPECIES: hypothetical protein [unclassified Bradyrhizobium]|uniref:hypothetical protein n=1 Tax=unclassified Bradyrhizobium TaxID=2631580 RepID=UPI0028F1615C|nr:MULTISPECIES: hypothetical protein [unclassified Bradyrhizobium]
MNALGIETGDAHTSELQILQAVVPLLSAGMSRGISGGHANAIFFQPRIISKARPLLVANDSIHRRAGCSAQSGMRQNVARAQRIFLLRQTETNRLESRPAARSMTTLQRPTARLCNYKAPHVTTCTIPTTCIEAIQANADALPARIVMPRQQ